MTSVQITPPPLSSQSLADLLCTIMVFCQGVQSNGKPFWSYICIKPSMAKAFKEARDGGKIFQLEDFGTILEWGEGKEPSDGIKQMMQQQYGVNHQFEDQLLQAIKLHEDQYAY